MNKPTAYLDVVAVAARALELPDADFTNGMTWGGSCAPGVGIATDNPNLEESLPSWTLLDQNEDARAPQVGQAIGGSAIDGGTTDPALLPVKVLANSVEGDGDAMIDGLATLTTLAAGWFSV